MSSKAKELAEKISSLVSEFENETPELNGELDQFSTTTAHWSLQLDPDDQRIKIVIETGVEGVVIESFDLEKMLTAMNFFKDLNSTEAQLLLSILEREEE